MFEDKTYVLRKNEKLFKASLEEFATKPFEVASTNEIIKNSDYNKGSFYYRFKTKEELYFALIDYIRTIEIAYFKELCPYLEKVEDLNTLIKCFFMNLKKLNDEDKYYVLLQRRIENENQELKSKISDFCIEPLMERIQKRIKEIHSKTKHGTDIELLKSTLKNLYYNGPYEIDDSWDKSVDKITEFLLSSPAQETEEIERKHLDIAKTSINPTYLLCDSVDYEYPEDTVVLSKILVDEKQIQNMIRETLKLRQITLEAILESGMKRNLKDYSHLLKLYESSFSNKSYHLLKRNEKILVLLAYLILIGKERIVIDDLLEMKDFASIKNLLSEFLPLLAKTSTIVVLESKYPIFLEYLDRIHFLDKRMMIRPIPKDSVKESRDELLLSYLGDKGLVVYKKMKRSAFNISEYLDKPLMNIQTFQLLKYEDLPILGGENYE